MILNKIFACIFRNREGKTALQEACRQGFNDMVIELVKHKADVSTRDYEGNSALHVSYNVLDKLKIHSA